jgi:hypothetical protein
MAPSSLFLKAAAAVACLGSGVAAISIAPVYPYAVDDVYQGNTDGTGFFDMFDFFTVSIATDMIWNIVDKLLGQRPIRRIC